jgi:hypothetical protein
MNASLPIANSPPYQAPTPVTMPAASPIPLTFDSVPFDQGRWDAWVAKGRRADAAFAEKFRTLTILGVAIAVGVGALSIFLG